MRGSSDGGEGLDYSGLVKELKKNVWEDRVTYPYSYRVQQLTNLRNV